MNSIKKRQARQNNRQVGSFYEQVASDYLEQLGYHILERNYRCRLGEIDIIGQDENYLVFIEIKYRHSTKCGLPRESVNYYKKKRILHVAHYYIMTHYKTEVACRFDVVEILGEQLTHLKAAF
ncbi:MAG: YraN family protein [Niameybacter sp.]|uniref:YraN family protein n=1 Tax=Niameybacter sp. TaxID=2033640 RepID=UPI002FC97DC4